MRMGGRIRRVAAAAGAVLMAIGMGGCGTSVSVVTEGAAQGPTIAIGVAADQPGLGWLHGGEYSGFDIDVAKYVAKKDDTLVDDSDSIKVDADGVVIEE